MDTSVLYQDDYVSSNYKDEQGVRQAFDRINSLPPEKSDNVGRVQCVNGFAMTYWNQADLQGRQPSIIDIGSGLCVFLYKMKEAGWDEAQAMDENYIEALKYGMPPTAGWGMGIERLLAIITDSHSVKEVILFPTLRPVPEH